MPPVPVGEYLPLAHKVHGTVPSKKLAYAPALHVQFRLLKLPRSECERGGQAMQADACVAPLSRRYLPSSHQTHEVEPFTSLYVPGEQAVHDPPLIPVKPDLHVQLNRRELPYDENEFEGQARHIVTDFCPDNTEYFPGEHDVHG
jgi:hypothetical protein